MDPQPGAEHVEELVLLHLDGGVEDDAAGEVGVRVDVDVEGLGDGGISPLLIETATVINLGSDPSRPLVVTVTAPTADEAEALGRDVIDALEPRVGGGDRRC